MSAMRVRHRGERVPPPMMRRLVMGVALAASRWSRLRRISKQTLSRMERYMWARVCMPRQPTMAPRALASQ